MVRISLTKYYSQRKKLSVVEENMTEREISACCYSEKEGVGVSFGVSFDAEEDTIDTLDTEWIWVGMSESFWENYFEFEDSIEKAKQLMQNDSNLTFREALYSVFGEFSIYYEIDGEEIKPSFEIDVNQAMYDMLDM